MTKIIEKPDIATMFSKGIVGAIPFVGPLAAEIIGATIPNQRIDRIESFLEKLENKIKEIDKEKVQALIKNPETIDLFEDAFIQASRALSEDRKEYIASLLKNSLDSDEIEYIEYKRLLSVLGELNDLEILMLISQRFNLMGCSDPESEQFWEKHREILQEPPAYMGSTQEEIDKNTIFLAHKLHLVNLGLLKPRFKKPNRGEIPEFDEKTGMIKSSGFDSTSLGRLLLKAIDQGEK
uniref:DUF4393 domain-containing protein n=1 Tax=uncultured Thiotrichaceae bacterium TaxID=298394 RepID=A0A6S6UMJ4_9GAMM|nr:MAG: Unknown protein [uncultured Thiotrichaceae bacterium]